MLHDQCPLTPGVYGWLDRNHQLCYVGKSKALRKRLLSYFAKTPADPKMGRIVRHSQRIVWEPVSHELLALIREQELINRWRPDFNKQGQPTRRQPAFLCVGDRADCRYEPFERCCGSDQSYLWSARLSGSNEVSFQQSTEFVWRNFFGGVYSVRVGQLSGSLCGTL